MDATVLWEYYIHVLTASLTQSTSACDLCHSQTQQKYYSYGYLFCIILPLLCLYLRFNACKNRRYIEFFFQCGRVRVIISHMHFPWLSFSITIWNILILLILLYTSFLNQSIFYDLCYGGNLFHRNQCIHCCLSIMGRNIIQEFSEYFRYSSSSRDYTHNTHWSWCERNI